MNKSHRFLLTLIVYLLIVIIQINAQIQTCPPNTWSCANRIQCINSTKLCDSSIDCNDGSDEGAVCSTLSKHTFRLEFHFAISKRQLCIFFFKSRLNLFRH
jgi:hypothetical protein